jgi:multiple sugar transport system substrate-binding protein
MFQALKAKGTPGGMALGHATGDSGWTQLADVGLRRQAGRQEQQGDIDSAETLKALEYGKELYATFIPGTLSWLDPNNNKAFLDSQISVTNNGISIYYAAKNSTDPKVKEMAADIQHASFPVGPVGVPTEYHLFFNQMVFKHTKYPKAAKEFVRFMMEEEQFGPWMQAAGGYISQPLRAYEKNPVWTVDPKHTPYRDSVKNMRPAGYDGQAGLRLGRRAGRLHRAGHGGRGRERLQDAQGSDAQRAAAARRALLQGLRPHPIHRLRAACRTAATSSGWLSCCPRRCCCCCS